MSDRLIPIPLWDDRQAWEIWDRPFLSCDLCGETELWPWMQRPTIERAWGQMYVLG